VREKKRVVVVVVPTDIDELSKRTEKNEFFFSLTLFQIFV